MQTRTLTILAAALLLASPALGEDPPNRAKPLKVGEKAPVLVVKNLAGKETDLKSVFEKSTTVLVMLRGYPGYQCPLCARQVAGYIGAAKKFEQAGAQVVLVYPGAVDNLSGRANEFLRQKSLPAPLTMAVDADYRLTNAYGLRWNASRETAYPATFIIGPDRKVSFAKVSRTHGGRVPASDVLKELGAEE